MSILKWKVMVKVYKASVIIPIYNVEEFLEECINSVVQQTIFNSLFVILVNDGSNDRSEEIAKKFEVKYENIKYILKENGGLSSARNAGIPHIKGKYVTFLDSDDKLAPKALEWMIQAAETHNADIVHGDLKIFPKPKEIYGPWKKHFGKGDQFISDISKYPDLLFNPSACNKLFKRDLFENHSFPIGMTFEDAYSVIPLMLKSKSIYLLDKIVYYYQKRIVTNSIMDNIYIKKKNYFDHLAVNEHLFKESMNYGESTKRSISRFILRTYNAFMCRIPENEELSIDEKRDIFHRLFNMYAAYPEEYFLEMGTNNKIRIMYYAIRNDDFELFMNPIFEDPHFNIIEGNMFFDLSKKHKSARRWFFLARGFIANVESMRVNKREGKVKFEGQFRIHCARIHSEFKNNIKVQVYVDGQPTELIDFENVYRKDLFNLFEENGTMNGFNFEVDLTNPQIKSGRRIEFKVKIFDCEEQNKFIEYPLGFQKTLFKHKGWYNLSKCTLLLDMNIKEKQFTLLNFKSNIITNHLRIKKYNQKKSNSSALSQYGREIYSKYRKKLKGKEIWLIGERFDTAQDNSYFLFKWIRENYPDKDIYYLIDPSSQQYNKIKELGNVIDYNSEEHLGYLLNAKVVINSYDIDSYMIPSMYDKNMFYQLFGDLIHFKRVYLNHGVNYNDHSIPLNRYRLQADLFITSPSEKEKNNCIITMNYDDNQVKNIGLVRFDNLKKYVRTNAFKRKSKVKKTILFMPTWRQYILPKSYEKNASDELINEKRNLFLSSDYFRKISDLLSSKQLHHFLEKNNIELQFYPHYEVRQFLDSFKITHPNITVVNNSASVQKLLIDCDLLITDYSSVFFDVAYMNKPICFYQFDYGEFYAKHYKKGYFDFKHDGFGPICINENDVINELRKINKNNFLNSKKFQSRIKRFYGENYLSHKHSEEVFEAINDLIKNLLKSDKGR